MPRHHDAKRPQRASRRDKGRCWDCGRSAGSFARCPGCRKKLRRRETDKGRGGLCSAAGCTDLVDVRPWNQRPYRRCKHHRIENNAAQARHSTPGRYSLVLPAVLKEAIERRAKRSGRTIRQVIVDKLLAVRW